MKIETIPQTDHQVKILVEVENEKLEGFKHQAARKISNRTKIPGFRPGKAPYDIVLRYIGEGSITEEAIQLLVDKIYPEILDEAKIKPAGPGSPESVDSMDPPKFTFLVPLEPTIDLGEYRNVRLDYDWKEPGEKEVNESIEELRRMQATTETVDRPIQKGDFVLVDIVGYKAKSGEGGGEALIDKPGTPLFISPEPKEDEFPFKGFSEQLIDLKPGESKTIPHKYPKSFDDDALKGQSVNFIATVKTIRGVNLPDLNDDFAKTVGSFESLSALKDTVKAAISQRSKSEYEEKYITDVIDRIKTGARINYPPQVLEHEVEHVLEDLEGRLSQQGMDMEAYLKSRNMERQPYIDEEIKPIAKSRLERSLILEKVASIENVEASDEILQNSFQNTYSQFQANPQFQKSLRGKQPSKQLLNAIAMESAGRAVTQLVFQRLKDIATGNAPELAPTDNVDAIVNEHAKPKKKAISKPQGSKKSSEKGNK